jgi:hypothetical protein
MHRWVLLVLVGCHAVVFVEETAAPRLEWVQTPADSFGNTPGEVTELIASFDDDLNDTPIITVEDLYRYDHSCTSVAVEDGLVTCPMRWRSGRNGVRITATNAGGQATSIEYVGEADSEEIHSADGVSVWMVEPVSPRPHDADLTVLGNVQSLWPPGALSGEVDVGGETDGLAIESDGSIEAWVLGPAAEGTLDITIRVWDPTGVQGEDSLEVEFQQANRAPTCPELSNSPLPVGQSVKLLISDPDLANPRMEVFTSSWTSTGFGNGSYTGTEGPTFDTTGLDAGATYPVVVTVADQWGANTGCYEQRFDVRMNTPPTIATDADGMVFSAGSIAIPISVDDSDQWPTILTFEVTANGQIWAWGNATDEFAHGELDAGDYDMVATAFDQSESASVNFEITVE